MWSKALHWYDRPFWHPEKMAGAPLSFPKPLDVTQESNGLVDTEIITALLIEERTSASVA